MGVIAQPPNRTDRLSIWEKAQSRDRLLAELEGAHGRWLTVAEMCGGRTPRGREAYAIGPALERLMEDGCIERRERPEAGEPEYRAIP